MTTPEHKVKVQIKKYLDSIGAYHVWPVPTGYGPKLLDCYACINGGFVVIEVKAPGKLPTPSQTNEIARINAAGGIAFYADSLERTKKYIEDHVLGLYNPEKRDVHVDIAGHGLASSRGDGVDGGRPRHGTGSMMWWLTFVLLFAVLVSFTAWLFYESGKPDGL